MGLEFCWSLGTCIASSSIFLLLASETDLWLSDDEDISKDVISSSSDLTSFGRISSWKPLSS
nr:hypothetical protein [Mycoplasma haemofelis]